MSQGCDGLSQMVAAYDEGDKSGVEGGFTDTGAFSTASEEAAGNVSKRAEVETASVAGRALFVATFEPPEDNDGDLVWRHQPLTARQQRAVEKGLAVCERF
jgi:hypothetical protein